MTTTRWNCLRRAAAFAALAALGSLPAAAADDPFKPAATLRPFAGESELLAYFEPFAAERRRLEEARQQREEEQRRRHEEARRKWEAENPGKAYVAPRAAGADLALSMAAPSAPAAAAAKAEGAAESITNTQTAGIDEGGIVKVHGKHLVILRRGRLFTVAVDRHQLAPVSTVEAFGPDVSPQGAWYDEMLVAGDTVAVIGYSYARGGTELGLFGIDAQGKLSYRGTYHLKSSDYYSSRNYASRLIGTRLVLYTPIPISVQHADPLARLPALRRWRPEATPADFRTITPPTRIYRSDEPLTAQAGSVTLHSIVSCDLAQPELRCESTGVLGGWGRVFYVSPTAVYVWAQQGRGTPAAPAALFRLPLDGGAPSLLKTQGSPIDQFSFLEQPDGMLNVLVRAQGAGDAMWRGERQGGNLALLRVPVREFGDGQALASAQAYRALPPAGEGSLQNRFVGAHLLYGAGSGWSRPKQQVNAQLQVVPLRGGETATLALPHGVDRIEAIGDDAVAIGTDGRDLVFSSVRLAGAAPAIAHAYRRADAAQGETRSHGFFYKPDDPGTGWVGLPIRGAGQGGYRQLWDEPAGMLYLHNDRLRLTEAGGLQAQRGVGRNDACRASCVDWYGNARPIFLRGRMFALLGYELVEGKVLQQGGTRRMVELRRISFAPGSADFTQ
jgi:hypothetical protein